MIKDLNIALYVSAIFIFIVGLMYALFYKMQVHKAERELGTALPKPLQFFLFLSIAAPIAFSLLVIFFWLQEILVDNFGATSYNR